jgi:hypothetical protein
MTQLKGRPPTFAVWCNKADGLRPDYKAFLRNNLRDEFGFQVAFPPCFRSTLSVFTPRHEVASALTLMFLINRSRSMCCRVGVKQGVPMRLLLRSTSTSLRDRLKKRYQNQASVARGAAKSGSDPAAGSPQGFESGEGGGGFGDGVTVKMSPPTPAFERTPVENKAGARGASLGGQGGDKGSGENVGRSAASSAAADVRMRLEKKQLEARLKRRDSKGRRASTKSYR